VLEQSLSRFISPEETREFVVALEEVVERGVTRNVILNPRSASGEVIPTSLNASALRDSDGNVIGAIGVLRDMRELDKARAYAESLIKNAPDPVFVSDLEGKILQANDAVSQLLGFRQDEVLEQSLSRFISPEETREFVAALREVVERGVTRNARLNPRSASGEVIPTSLNASALRDPDGKVIGAIGVLRNMRAYEQVVHDLERSKSDLQEKILDLEKFEEVVVGRELKMIGGWYDYSAYENGDKCAWVGYTEGIAAPNAVPGGLNNITGNDGKQYAVQSLWSNSSAAGAGWCAGAGDDLPGTG
jgi:PAS domain S-box-containing protein